MKQFSVLLEEQFGHYVKLNEIDPNIKRLSLNPVGLYFKNQKPEAFDDLKQESVKSVCVRPHCFNLKEFLCILHTMAYKYEEKCVFLVKIESSIYVILYYKKKNHRLVDILKIRTVLERIKGKELDLQNSLIFIKDFKI